MFGEVGLDHNVLLLAHVGTVGLHHQQLTLPELVLAGAVVDAVYVVGVVSDFEPLLDAPSYLHRPA